MQQARKDYADGWKNSADYYYKNSDYDWMCSQIEQFDKVLEIGCGTGESTLSLIEHGHTVIAIEKNEYCLEKAMELIKRKGYTCGTIDDEPKEFNVIFIFGDMSNIDFMSKLIEVVVDVVICWNIGTYWDDQMRIEYFRKFINDDFSYELIVENEESTYAEYVQRKSLEIAKHLCVPMHFIDRDDRSIENADGACYFENLKDEYGYSMIKLNDKKSTYLSSNSIPLKIGNQLSEKVIFEIYLLSIMFLN